MAGIPRLMPAAGVVVAAAVGGGTVVAAGVAAAGTAVALGYTGFAAWLAWLGISLVVRSRTGAAPR
ncbi:hypothetical protein [Agromyces sp. NPDC049794]|uniref:hypothetical protein n=1 Tax=Agromyces sp. NPDC049794 TaxID=3154362 RepID=UPI0033D42BD6